MSQENVELATRAIEMFNRRDLSAWDAEYTSDYTFYPGLIGAVEGDSFHGREGVKRYYEMIANAFDEWRVLPERFRDLPGCVLVRVRVEGRGRGSGIPLVAHQSLVIDFRDGRIAQVRGYLDEAEALKAVGLEE